MVEYNVDYKVNYKGETTFSEADVSWKKTVILTREEAKSGKNIIDIIKNQLIGYFADVNGLPREWINVSILTAVCVSA